RARFSPSGDGSMTARKSPIACAPLVVGMCVVWLLATPAAVRTAPVQDGADKGKQADAPRPEDVLRRAADFFKKAKSVAVDLEREQKVGAMSIKGTVSIAFERPNRIAIRPKEDPEALGVSAVCDGKKLSIAVPMMKKYTEENAPASLDAM